VATTASIQYSSAAELTWTLANLASDANLLIGRESTAIDNQTNLYVDAVVGGKIKTGTTTANTRIEVWAYGMYDLTTYSNGATGSDAGLTIVSQLKPLFKLVTVIPVFDTTARTYTWGPFSVANLFGGIMPAKWGLWCAHNTGANLDATGGNHEARYVGIKYTSA
jgi:hypothetical protein